MRAVKEPDEVERIAAAARWPIGRWRRSCRRSGRDDGGRARLRLEWLMRTGGAEALAFDVACLAGPEAALPHGSPGERPILGGRRPPVRLRRPGRGLPERHDADAVRRRAVGARPRRSTSSSPGLSRRAIDAIEAWVADGGERPERRGSDAIAARASSTRTAPGRPTAMASATGSASPPTRSRASAAARATTRSPARRCSRSSPGSTSPARPGVRIEDLVHVDADRAVVERLTRFPRDVIALPG